MKIHLLALLCLALLLCGFSWAEDDIGLRLAFGDMTPSENDSSFGGTAGSDNSNDSASDNSSDSGSSNPGSGSSGSGSSGSGNSGSGSSGSGNSGAAAGGTIINQYEPDAYDGEKSADQQLIEEAWQLYGSPRLSSLSLGEAALIPVFNSENFAYIAYVQPGQNSVTVSAYAASGSISINGLAGSSRVVNFSGEEQTVRIVVSDQGLSTTYSIMLLRAPDFLQVEPAFISHIQISNDDFFFEREISEADGHDIKLALPLSAGKKYYVSVTVNREVLVYYNNIRVYNGYYYQDSGAWTWMRELKEISGGGALLGVHLVDIETRQILNYYSFEISHQASLEIQLQVENPQCLINGELYELEVAPRIIDGYTVVPLRFVAEALGAKVDWQPQEQRIDIELEGQKLSLVLGEKSEDLPLAAFIENGRTMVPLRYISEKLQCQVEWLAETSEIIITR